MVSIKSPSQIYFVLNYFYYCPTNNFKIKCLFSVASRSIDLGVDEVLELDERHPEWHQGLRGSVHGLRPRISQ